MREILHFQPLYMERIWGGRSLETSLGRTLPQEVKIGESWEIVDRVEAQSVARGGPFAGRTLREILSGHGETVMGPNWPAERRFPLLVKWLDCHQRLSLQVHPPAAVAAELKGEPKTENWFIAETAPGAQLIAGLRRGVTRQQFEQALATNAIESCVHRFPVATGDSLLVPSGRVHAIDAGNLILEIQQNSDTTYRVHDWGRAGTDGRPRRLHIEESLRSILWDDFEPTPLRAAPISGVVAECAEFRIRRIVLGPGEHLAIAAGEQPRVLSVVTGRVELKGASLGRGENVLLPYASELDFRSPDMAMVLLTENFA
ncbi:MAG TPA: type I phosphomannose isomerase catalytic subunit [Opitutaceae bacterium]|nr:type I phosphomannose isomerase catalytic subunit [Opitutaceae bacterium]